ncbi:MAG TPA: hypothetical protein DIU14_05610, partial [Actinobacteria bacterium]|nr:hypothetical protein [Actinomycetota bacterium]
MPAPTPEQADRLQALLDAMPPLCRAESIDGSGGGRHPGEVVGDMLLALTDEVARSALCGRLPLPPRRGRPPRTVPPPERFVLALAEEPPRATMSGDPNELAALGKAVDGWHRSGLRAAGPIRTCFRLVPPDGRDQPEQDEPWRVEFLLQSTEDPSLLVPAERVWRAGRRLPAFGGTVEEPQERLLEDLGRAVRLWPDLDGALNEPQPTAVSLDPAGAHRFLRETAPLLEQAGLGVMVPPWWGSGLRLGVRLRARSASAPRTAGPGRFGLDEVVDYRYEVALGDETLSPEELHELAALKVPLVRMRGGGRAPRRRCGGRPPDPGARRAAERGDDGRRGPAGRARLGAHPRGASHRGGGGGGVAGGPSVGRPEVRAPAGAPHVRRAPPPISGAGAGVAGVPRRPRPGRVPGRRHGPR